MATFDRRLSGPRTGQHKAPPEKNITVEVTATVQQAAVTATLVDLFPASWALVDSGGGDIAASGDPVRIAWSVGALAAGQSVTRTYVLASPVLQSPPASYDFTSSLETPLGTAQDSAWRVTVADPAPPSGISYLHAADAVVSGTTYNTVDVATVGGTLTNAGGSIATRRLVTPFSDGGITVWASDPVPTGATWSVDSAMAWDFDVYVKATGANSSSKPWFAARLYRIAANGNATLLWDQSGGNCNQSGSTSPVAGCFDPNISSLPTATYQRVRWSAAPSGGPWSLAPGERIGVGFAVYASSNGYAGVDALLGFDEGSAPSKVTMAVLDGTANQNHFRFGSDVGLGTSWIAGTDVTPTGFIPAGQDVRVRMQVYNSTAAGLAWSPRLEFATSTAAGATWTAVPTTAGTDPFAVVDSTQFANGAAITAAALGTGPGNWQNGAAYDTANPPTIWTLAANSYTEVEWNLRATASAAGAYYFRVSNNGTALTTYEHYAAASFGIPPGATQAHARVGNDAPLASMTWKAAADTAAPAGSVLAGSSFRVRFQLFNDSGLAYTWQPQVEVATGIGGPWTPLPTMAGSAAFYVADTPQFTHGAAVATGTFALGPGTGTPQAGTAYDAANPAASSSLGPNAYTELEFNLSPTANASVSTTYYFRLTSAGTTLKAYQQYGSVVYGPTAGAIQAHVRIGDDAPLGAMTWKAATDATAPLGTVLPGAGVRVRFQLYNDGPVYTWQPRIEVAGSAAGPWSALPTAAGAEPFYVADTAQFVNGATITAAALGAGTGTWQNGLAYDTVNPPAASSLNASSYAEVEFNLQSAGPTAGAIYYFRLTDNGASLKGYQQYASLVFGTAGGAVQAHFRIGDDSPLAAPTWKAATDEVPPAGTVLAGAPFRVRFQVDNDGGTTVSWRPQVEMATSTNGPWSVLPSIASAEPFYVADTAQVVDGAVITVAGLGGGIGTWQDGVAYDTSNPPVAPWGLAGGAYTEVEYSLASAGSAVVGTDYYFRLTDGGAAIASYQRYPSVVFGPAGSATQAHVRIGDDAPLGTMIWKAATDTTAPAGSVLAGSGFRVRFQLFNVGASYSWRPRIEVATATNGTWSVLPTTAGTVPFSVMPTALFLDGDPIVAGALGAGTGTWQNGAAYDTSNPPAAPFGLAPGSYTELEYSVQASATAVVGTTYYFRLTDNGTPTAAYQQYASLVFGPAPGATQAHFRIGNDNGLGTSWLAATDAPAPAGSVPAGINVRVRFQVFNDGSDPYLWLPQIEVATATAGPWVAVPVTADSTPFYVAESTQFADGDPIPTAALGAGTGAWQPGIVYDLANPPATSWALSGGSYSEIEFNLRAAPSAVTGQTYSFRLTDAGTPVAGYQQYAGLVYGPVTGATQAHVRIGDDAPLGAMTWKAGVDSLPPAGTILSGTRFRVRFQLFNAGSSPYTWQPRIEVASSAAGPWSALPTTAGADPFNVADTAQFADGAAITAAALGAGTGAWQNGFAYDTVNPPAAWPLNASSFTEVEWDLMATSGAVVGTRYYFRLTDAGTAVAAYQQLASVIYGSPPPTPAPAPPAHNLLGSAPQTYGPDTVACAGCHRVHTANAPEALRKQWLLPAANGTTGGRGEESTCFTCHDGTGAPNIRAEFLKGEPSTTGQAAGGSAMPIWQTTGVHKTAEARTGISFSGANRHVECEDCHNPHQAARPTHALGTNTTAGPQQGMWGVAPATWPAAWADPDPLAGFQVASQVTYQYELCFKCHSNWAYGSNPPPSPSGGFAQTNQSKEFNPNNPSYHPVAAPGKNPFVQANGTSYAGSLLNGLTPNSTLSCTDCHGSNSDTSPKGPHGSTYKFILRGAWDRTIGGNVDKNGTQYPNNANGVCFKCHDVNVYGAGYQVNSDAPWDQRTGFSGGGKNLHGVMVGARNKANDGQPIVCMDCHVAIPHGWQRDHLLGFTGDGAPYVNRPYAGGLTTIDTWSSSGQWAFNSCGTAMGTCK